MRADAEHFIDISALRADIAAQRIHADGIHVLINLNGYTKGARNEIFALQPAPLQVSYMGFPGSMGAPYIQYLITDMTTSPAHLHTLYTERLVYMPHCYFVSDYKQSFRQVMDTSLRPTRAQLGLPPDAFIFYCPNQLYKIEPTLFDVWCRILHRVPTAVLWLLRFPAVGEPHILEEAARRGLAPGRIVFSDQAPKHQHVLRSTAADLFLDTVCSCCCCSLFVWRCMR